ncbi:MAG: cytidylate kinase-like family protein [Candidatus Cryptobacteroides sp.]|jgi:cytidylate kinase|nr:cytidylate kinase-like family protein [Bacteroides sp.]MCI7547156.1 cytidylate kinase-like family protein [Bacteroides sp.]MCI7664233.1 cytidylate kinase-like family protein [Bacteroides sp.]MDY5302370.1 cytidylate kinase-like family protein [Candidatus Cryptobacteroides sp.]MDY5407238.1 cytidylate kinase-like family protein [Candidatus Cryptobacteroides sp.]
MKDNELIINVGRQFGSGGRLVALALGRKLGIPVYDQELIAKAAEQSGFSKELFANSDEKRNLLALSSFIVDVGRFGSADNYMSDNQLFVIQSNVIRSLADKGPAIFIGRCSDYILRDRKCLDVFVTATDEVRIKRIAERMNITPEQADSLMRKKDRTRETYYNYYTFGNWGVASNYDLCVDSSVLGIEGTADMIIDFCRRAGLLSKDAVLPFSDVNQEAGK